MSEELTVEECRRLRAGISEPPWEAKWAQYIPPDHDGLTFTLRANSEFIAAAPSIVDFLLSKVDELTAERCPSILLHGLAHSLIARILEADAKCDPPTDIGLRLEAIIRERDNFRAKVDEQAAEIEKLYGVVRGHLDCGEFEHGGRDECVYHIAVAFNRVRAALAQQHSNEGEGKR